MPETIRLDPKDESSFREQLGKIKAVLDGGGIIIFPTDTFYGLGANPFHRQAVRRVFEVKQRPADKPLLLLISDRRQVHELADEISVDAEKAMDRFWPGPLTLLFKSRPQIPAEVTASSGKIGIRLPGSELTRRLIAGLDIPLTAPSANISGEDEPQTVASVSESLRASVDLILDGGATPGGKVSTILDTTQSPPVILREGAMSRQAIDSLFALRSRE